MREIATFLCFILIAGLFVLDRGREAGTSKALWLPTIYLLICGSRPVSIWLGLAPSGGGASIYVEGSPVDRAIYIALLAAALIVVIKRWERAGPLLGSNGPILLFFAFAAVSFIWSDFPLVTVKHWTKSVCDLLMMVIVATEGEPIVAIRRVLTRAGFILIPVSLLLCKYYPLLGRKLSKGWSLLYIGVTGDKNELGLICVIFGLASWWCFLAACRDRGRKGRYGRLLAHGIIVGIAGWLLGMCDSMTSVSSLVMIGVVLLVIGQPAPGLRVKRVHIAVAAIAGLSLFALFFNPGGQLVSALGRNPTLTGRTDVWHDVLQVPINPVIGTGYESFWLGHRLKEVRALARFDVNEAHDGYLEMYLNLGWIGVLLLATLILTGYGKIIAAFRRNPALGSLAMALFLATVFHSLSEAGFRMQSPSWIFFLWAIVASSQVSSAGGDEGGVADDSAEFGETEPEAEHAVGLGFP